MQFTAQQIAAIVGGNIEGDPNTVVRSVAKIEEAKDGDLSFIANPKYEEYIYTSKASVIIVNSSFEFKGQVSPTLIRVKDAYGSFAVLLEKYNEMISGAAKTGIEEYAKECVRRFIHLHRRKCAAG